MFKINEVVVHKYDICKITEINKDFRLGEDYYTLIPIADGSLVIHTPVLNKQHLIRSVISKENAEKLINTIPDIELIELNDEKTLESQYVALINSGKHEDLVKIIKTTYLRNTERENDKKKLSEKDKRFLKQAEKLFYSELAIALEMTYQETKDYVTNKVIALSK